MSGFSRCKIFAKFLKELLSSTLFFPKSLVNYYKRKEIVNNNQWGLVRGEIGIKRYDKLMNKIAAIHRELCDTKVSVETKRILRLPST